MDKTVDKTVEIHHRAGGTWWGAVLSLSLSLMLAAASCERQRSHRAPNANGVERPAQGGGPPVVRLGPSHTARPERRDATDARIAQLQVPPGFRLSVFASGLENVRMLAIAEDGIVYVSRQAQGDVLALSDRDRDGHADSVQTVATGLDHVNGIVLRGGHAYFATPTTVYVADRIPGGGLSAPRAIVNDLPEPGRHPNRTLAFGPDGLLYVSVGSSCNVCREHRPEYASLLRMRSDGTQREIFAQGLRNTIGFDWHPVTGQLWGTDQGSDERGDNLPPEELNLLKHGGDYGWPWCFAKRIPDPKTLEEVQGNPRDCGSTQSMALGYTAHAAPMAFAFYKGPQFPPEYRGDAFAAMHGSWNRTPPSGYEVVRVRFQDGHPTAFEPFLTGFLIDGGAGHFGRPVGLAVTPDGDLLVTDDSNGLIYRVTWSGSAVAS